MQTSKRIGKMQLSPIRRLIPYANAAKKRGIKVFHLNIGQPDIETPKVFMKAIKEAEIDVLAYADSRGWDPLRQSMADYYKRIGGDFELEDFIITNGGSEALQWVFVITCDIDDEILVPEPFYTNYNSFTAPFTVSITPITTQADKGFALPDEASIVELITDRTRCIALSNPGNPTGVVYTREEVEMIAKIAKEHDLFIIADEVYREFCYDGKEAVSFATLEDVKDRVIIVDSVSKRFSACGARIGCIASKNKDVMLGALKMAQGRLSSPTLEMIGAKALYDLDPNYFDPIRERYQRRRDVMIDAMEKMDGVMIKRPAGAFYAIASLPVDNAEKFAIWMLSEFEQDGKTVMVAPVENFYASKNMGLNEARLAYVLKEEDLHEAMKILDAGLKAYPGRTI